jgi:hypothetical protein
MKGGFYIMGFYEDIQLGKVAEKLFLKHFKDTPFLDVRNDKEYQKIDVDFVNSKTGEKVEVKGNFTKYENLFLEIISSTNINSSGWYNHTQADTLAYLMLEKSIMIFIPLELLREAVKELQPRKVTCNTGSGNYGVGYILNMYLLKQWIKEKGYNTDDYFLYF